MRQLRANPPQWLWALALIGITVVAYLPALHGGFIWDDDIHISGNRTLRSLHGLWEIWTKPGATCQYYPLTFTAFWIEYQLWGLDTFGYHLINVLLHGLAAVLLWQVLAKLKVPGGVLAGAIFALHPVNVMSVAWMTELKNTLSGCLALGMIWAYLHFAGLDAPGVERSSTRWRYYVLALLLLVLALFAKTASSFLPVTLLLVLWWQRSRLTRRDLLPLIPVFGTAVAMGMLTIYVEQHSGGASGKEFHLSALERILVSGRSFFFYLGKLFVPVRLLFNYERWQVDVHAWWQYLYPLGAAMLFLGLWSARRKIGKAPFAAAIHFYVGTSMLVLLVVLYMTRYSFVSDHWQYFGCMSIIALVASGIITAANRVPGNYRPGAVAVILALLLTLGFLTWRQAHSYRDIETLWRATLAENPDSWFAHTNLGAHLQQTGRDDDAFSHLRRAVELNPNVTETRNGLASALFRTGRPQEAAEQARAALNINSADAEANANLGAALLQMGRISEAIASLQKCIALDPGYVEAHSNLGYAYSQIGRLQESIAALEKAVKVDPSYPPAHYNLSNTFLHLGRTAEALGELQATLEIDPNDAEAKNNAAWIMATSPDASLRNGARALELAGSANELTAYRNPVIVATLAAALASTGDFADARKTAERAMAMAADSENSALAADIRRQLESYSLDKPFLDDRGSPAKGTGSPFPR